MVIPFSDLRSMHREIKTELQEVFDRVINESSFVLGPEVIDFENKLAEYVGTAHCIGVNSGTAALHMTLASLGVGPGDEVITVAHTFMATAEAISAVGARPVFIDIDSVSFTMDPSLLQKAITSKTRAIIPVHLYGQSADMDPILDIADKHGIPVIEDACQAHGAEYKGSKVGSLGIAGCFSFFPGKNLGALGEGGAVTTSDPELAHRIRLWREHGSLKKYEHEFPAFNMRMNGLQGGFLSVKLKHLDRWNNLRRDAALKYAGGLAGSGVTIPVEMEYGRHVYHLYVIQVDQRDRLKQQLAKTGIESGLHYPIPLHLQKAYHYLGYKRGNLPMTERAAGTILSLPIYPGITTEMIAYVTLIIQEEVLNCL